MTTSHVVTITDPTGEVVHEFRCAEDQSVLVGMERVGRDVIQVGCRGGGCGVCKVELVTGDVAKRRMSRAHVTESDEAAGYVLACRIFPRGDVVVRLISTPADIAA